MRLAQGSSQMGGWIRFSRGANVCFGEFHGGGVGSGSEPRSPGGGSEASSDADSEVIMP